MSFFSKFRAKAKDKLSVSPSGRNSSRDSDPRSSSEVDTRNSQNGQPRNAQPKSRAPPENPYVRSNPTHVARSTDAQSKSGAPRKKPYVGSNTRNDDSIHPQPKSGDPRKNPYVGGIPIPVARSSRSASAKSSAAAQCPCWKQALDQLSVRKPKAYERLQSMQLDTKSLTNMIETQVGACGEKNKTTASSQWYGRLRRFLPALSSVKALSMTVAKADPHQLAPYICAGVFCVLELALNVMNPEDVFLVLEIVCETTIILRKWLIYEAYHASRKHPATESTMDELFQELPNLYLLTLRLLLKIDSHLNSSRLNKATDRISQVGDKWKAMFEKVKRSNKTCDALKSQAEFQLNIQKDGQTVLNWISAGGLEESHSQIMERTGVSDKYKDRGAWLFQSEEFTKWRQGIDGKSTKRALWLKGSVGTGKTTLICRVIETFIFDQSLEPASKIRTCHFYCSSAAGSTPPTATTVIRALLRQLALLPDCTVSPAAMVEYNRRAQGESQKGALSLGDWKALFKRVVSQSVNPNPCVILVDALDECATDEAEEILGFFGSLIKENHNIFVMVTSQLHVKVHLYLDDEYRLTIQSGSKETHEDVAFYVKTEIIARTTLPRNRDGSIMSKSGSADLLNRLETALITGANGMFQWVRTWLAVMFPVEPIAHRSEADELLHALESQDLPAKSEKEQWKFLEEAYLKLYTRVRHRPVDRKYKVRAYRIILGACRALSPAAVAEATAVEDDGTMATSIGEDYIREVCHNFFIEVSGCLQAAHDSAKTFLLNMLDGADVSSSQLDDYSAVKNNAEIARICIQVLADQHHPVWTRHHLDPGSWASKFADDAQLKHWEQAREVFASKLEYWMKTYTERTGPDRFSSTTDFVNKLQSWFGTADFHANHLASYIIKYWPTHWEDMVVAVDDGHLSETEFPLQLAVLAIEDSKRSALFGCASRLNAYRQVFYIHGATPFLPELDPILDSVCTLRNSVQIRLSRSMTRMGGSTWKLEVLLLITVFRLLPQKYFEQYVEAATLPDKTSQPELEQLWTLLDRATANLHFRRSDDAGEHDLLDILMRDEGRAEVVEFVLRLERKQHRKLDPTMQSWKSVLLDARGRNGATPLHNAASMMDSTAARILKVLLEFEADQTGCLFPRGSQEESGHWISRHACRVNTNLHTPLHLAASNGNNEAVSVLIEAGAEDAMVENINGIQTETTVLNARDVWGDTPLSWAAEATKNRTMTLEALLKAPGLDVNAPNQNGALPLHKLVISGSKDEDWLRSISLFLKDKRTNPQLVDGQGRTPLWLAAQNGEVEIVRLLCERGDVDLDQPNRLGRTPLWIAKYESLVVPGMEQQYKEISKLLLATERVDPNPVDHAGRSPKDATGGFSRLVRSDSF